jgi:hypothetical protein
VAFPDWNLEVLIFVEGGKTRETGEKPSKQGRESTNDSLTYDAKSH